MKKSEEMQALVSEEILFVFVSVNSVIFFQCEECERFAEISLTPNSNQRKEDENIDFEPLRLLMNRIAITKQTNRHTHEP